MIVLVDHRDSFTFNLVHLLCGAGADVCVIDEAALPIVADRLLALQPAAFVLSPGPGRPDQATNTHRFLDQILEHFPILGICLGHQILVEHFGGKVGHAPKPVHGNTSSIRHDGTGLFGGLPPSFRAMRYHSLCATRVPADLRTNAWLDASSGEEALCMGVVSDSARVHGLQFHPESFESDFGLRLMNAFLLASEINQCSRGESELQAWLGLSTARVYKRVASIDFPGRVS